MLKRLFDFFKRLFGSSSKVVTLPGADPEFSDLPWMVVARKYIGVHEVSGSKSHPKIAEWLKGVGQNGSDEIAWCAAAVNGILKEAGYKGSRRANARSLLDVGTVLKEPKLGCIIVLWRGSIQGWQGHVGFLEKVSADGKMVRILGGNQSDEFNSAWFTADRILGFTWPEKQGE